MLEKLKYLIVESIFPAYCVWCEGLGYFVCPDCSNKILKVKVQTCLFCNKISGQGKTCKPCRSKNYLTGILSYGYFKDRRLREVIHAYKYEDLFALKSYLASCLLEVIKKETVSFDLVTYIPLGKKRLVKRGYNQSQLLALELAKLTSKKFGHTLVKIKETRSQVGLSRKERITNLEGAFRVSSLAKVKDKKILIIDDVVTTGTTLNEAARLLRQEGAREVWGLTIAKE